MSKDVGTSYDVTLHGDIRRRIDEEYSAFRGKYPFRPKYLVIGANDYIRLQATMKHWESMGLGEGVVNFYGTEIVVYALEGVRFVAGPEEQMRIEISGH